MTERVEVREPATVIFDLLPLEQVVAGNQEDVGARSVLVDRTRLPWCAPVGRGPSAGICRDSETVVPVLTSAAARRRVSGVIRFRAPRSSSLPHRPQFDSFVIHSSNCAFVTRPVFGAPDPADCDDCAAWPTTSQTPESEAAMARTSPGRRCRPCRPERKEIRSSMARHLYQIAPEFNTGKLTRPSAPAPAAISSSPLYGQAQAEKPQG